MKTKIAAALMIVTAGSALLAANTAGAEESKASRHHGHMPPHYEFREVPHHHRHMPHYEFREPPHHHRHMPPPHHGREIGVPPRW